MPTLTFWNLAKRAPLDLVGQLVSDQTPDVLIFAECHHPNADILQAISTVTSSVYHEDMGATSGVSIYTTLAPNSSSLIYDSHRVKIRNYHFPLQEPLLVVAVHLGSKLYQDSMEQSLGITNLARLIDDAEEKVRHKRTVVIGDFNMNPFEPGMISFSGMHSIRDRSIASKQARTCNGATRDFFYNPMWTFFQHRDGSPRGTYYYNSSTDLNYYWNMFDQVIVRPSLLRHVPDENVRIITSVSGTPLHMKNGIPKKSKISDHFPITVDIRAEWS